uniref:Uncharacterized protein n=1 Tax=Nelumbo nucifera TaxID=4432 RepID=A0A822XA68_NELNU|nr:TPA_asm: hypothetical protein HUJ06_019807 [Nelumbo nucifera]
MFSPLPPPNIYWGWSICIGFKDLFSLFSFIFFNISMAKTATVFQIISLSLMVFLGALSLCKISDVDVN